MHNREGPSLSYNASFISQPHFNSMLKQRKHSNVSIKQNEGQIPNAKYMKSGLITNIDSETGHIGQHQLIPALNKDSTENLLLVKSRNVEGVDFKYLSSPDYSHPTSQLFSHTQNLTTSHNNQVDPDQHLREMKLNSSSLRIYHMIQQDGRKAQETPDDSYNLLFAKHLNRSQATGSNGEQEENSPGSKRMRFILQRMSKLEQETFNCTKKQ